MAAAAELVRRMGKTPAVVGDCAGFLVNRILLPYLIESAWMFEEGVSQERIDKALEGFGMPMGPLALVDEVGIDTGYKVAKVLESAYGSRMQVASVLGNVAEWTMDHYRESFYTELADPADSPWARSPDRSPRTVRGGAFDDEEGELRCAARVPSSPRWQRRDPQIPKSRWWNTDAPHVGFRLVSPDRSYTLAEIEAFWRDVLGS